MALTLDMAHPPFLQNPGDDLYHLPLAAGERQEAKIDKAAFLVCQRGNLYEVTDLW
jgi:hypothetical protein